MKKQQGLTLIEVLVTMLILGVGLLGMASLQVQAVKNTDNSNLRSMAIYFANDMGDRIRANRQALNNGNYNNLDNAALTANCLTLAGCNSASMANHDKQEWQNNIATALPGGAASLAGDGVTFNVTVSWNERVTQTGNAIAVASTRLAFRP